MPPARQPHDPFTDAPLRLTTSNATSLATNTALRSQASQHSLRSNASNASSRTRQQGSLFAPSLSRRPTSRTTPRVEDGILADSDSEPDEAAAARQEIASRRHAQMGRARHGSPESKHSRLKPQQEEELDIVNRRPDGNYLLGIDGYAEASLPVLKSPEMEDEEALKRMDDHYAAVARQYFATGTPLSGRGSKKHEEEFEEIQEPMMRRMRELVMQKLDEERWLYEPTNSYQLPMR